MSSPCRGALLCLLLLISGVPWSLQGEDDLVSKDPASQASAQPATARTVRTFQLTPGKSGTFDLAADEVHHYSLALKKGQVLRLFVNQAPKKNQAVDVTIRLQDPAGLLLYEVDHPRDFRGTEEVHLIAQSDGLHSVEIWSKRQGAYRIFCRTLPRPSRTDELESRAEKLYFRAQASFRQNVADYEPIVTDFLDAEKLWSKAGDRERQADALFKAASVLTDRRTGQWELLLQLSQRLAVLRRALGDPESEAIALIYVGNAHESLGKPDLAEQDYRRALRLTNPRFPELAAKSMRSLGGLLSKRRETNDALIYLERSLDILKAGDSLEEKWKSLDALRRLYASLGDRGKTLEYLQESLRLAEEMGSENLMSQSYARAGDYYFEAKNWRDAEFYYGRARQLRQRLGQSRDEAVVLGDISLIYREQARFEDALRTQRDALNVYRRSNDSSAQVTAYCNLGIIYLDLRDPFQAEQNFERCGELAKSQGDREGELNSYYGQALAQRDRNNPDLAILSVEKAIDLIERIGPQTLTEGVESDFVNARTYSYELLIDLLLGDPLRPPSKEAIKRAFEASEKARWRTLLGSIGSPSQGVSLLDPKAADLAAQAKRLMTDLGRTDEDLQRIATHSARAKRLKGIQNKRISALRIIENRLRVAGRERQEPVTLSEAQGLIDRDTVVLEYFLGGRHSFLFVLTSSSLEAFVLPDRHVVDESCDHFHELISESKSKKKSNKAWESGRDFGKMLGQDTWKLKSKSRLVIVPDSAIHKVPFGALPMVSEEGGQGKYLIETHEISKIPSLSVLRILRAKVAQRSAAPKTLAVLAAPELSSDYEPLPNSRREGQEVLSFAPIRSRLGAFGSKASRALALSGELKNYQYILFSTHGEDHPEQPELSSILLSGRDMKGKPLADHLWLQDIKKMNLNADCVVLGACRTALGHQVPGEGSMGLPQAFLSAGSARVVVSLWNVNDASTADLVIGLFRLVLVKHRTPAQALRAAQLQMLRSKDRSAPYYWAGFELYGEWR